MANIKPPHIVVDDREARGPAISELQKLGAQVELRRLPVADFLLSEQVAVERKTPADFEASVMDGRLFDQARNLVESYPKPLLVVTGNKFERLSGVALRGALLSLALDYRLPVVFVTDEASLARMLFHAAQREQSEKKANPLRVEKRAFTDTDCQRFIVESLPGVGPELARRLLEKFGRVENVFTATEEELMQVEGMGEQRAEAIRKVMEGRYNLRV